MAEVELRETPSLGLLYPKAVAGMRKRGGTLPERAYTRTGVRVDPEHLAAYSRVCGFRLSDALPITYPHVLGFPLQVKLMTDGDFPFPLIGSVHLRNRIAQTRALRLDEPLDLRVHAENQRPHAKGTQFDMITSATAGGAPVWHDTSTYLVRGPGTGASDPTDRPTPPPATATWRAPDDIGRRYAEVSGDRNPIHLHPLTARLFGFSRAIAHGMWTKARCLSAFEGRLPEAHTVDVRFKLPVLLPTTLTFATDGHRFTLASRSGKPHLDGTITT